MENVIVWFRNDLRLRDNKLLAIAEEKKYQVIPFYGLDDNWLKNDAFGFQKMGAFRAKFLLESLNDLKQNLQAINSDLFFKIGEIPAVLSELANEFGITKILANKAFTNEEIAQEKALTKAIPNVKITYISHDTLYHINDLPFAYKELPNVFTQFRNKVEKRAAIRTELSAPRALSTIKFDSTAIPKLSELGYDMPLDSSKKAIDFKGGENAALARLHHYLWETKALSKYKITRNGLLGANYSSKFSPWLAAGCISPRTIYYEVSKYEAEIEKNDSTYWLIFELLWRDFFKFYALKYGAEIFKLKGPKNENLSLRKNQKLFDAWASGNTGVPFIDANMRELNDTGFMSNRGRQNVASFLVKDLGIDWRMGAAYFESLLIDYDPCSNYGNWNYVAGVGADPRENRYFNIMKQAKTYDTKAEFVKYWIDELRALNAEVIFQHYLSESPLSNNYPAPLVRSKFWKLEL